MKKSEPSCWHVGITGGIGSGKSTVSRLFAVLGIPVYDADHWARWQIENDAGLRAQITALMGPDAYLPDGRYNRPLVASRVFSDKSMLTQLNALVHPAVALHHQQWHEDQCRRGAPYTLKEAALLVENGSYRQLDALIVVTAPEALRLQRVVLRDGLSEEAVRARMANQLPEEAKLACADFVIKNDGESLLSPQVWQIHQLLLQRK